MGARRDDPSGPEGGSALADEEGTPISSDFLREVARAPAAAPDAADALAGTTLGRYRVLAKLGRGGMGVVYAAEDLVLQRPVALKVLPSHLVLDAERRRRFLREARSAAAAAHPSIAAIYDVEEIGDQIIIAMERVEGRTLRAALAAAAGGLPAREVARIGHRIACGLSRAHEAGVIHRDLKPDNVMIGEGDEVKILDFGVAKLRQGHPRAAVEARPSTLTGEGQLLGTPSYMAPEQAKGLSIDERADLFSLGVILYEMATGARPFTGATSAQIIIALDRDEPAPPTARNPALPVGLERVILRCLQKRPEDRFASGEAVAEALRPFAVSRAEDARGAEGAAPSSAPPSATPAPAAAGLAAPSPARPRRRWVFAIGALAAALPLAVAGVRGQEGPRAPASPLAPADAVLACPVLEVAGVEEPAGWLGAAAANAACRRARAILGGAEGRVLLPASLLDLPRQPRDDFPADPYAEPDARPRTLAAARARAAAYLDGSVSRERGSFRVRLVLRDRGDGALAEGEGRAAALHQAVQGAMASLVHPGAIPRAAAVDPVVAIWSGIRDVDLLVALEDWSLASAGLAGMRQEEARLAPRQAELGPRWAEVQVELSSTFGEGWDRVAAPPVDRSSPSAFARSAPVHAQLTPLADPAALAEEARALAAAEPSAAGRAALTLAEAGLREQAGDTARARALLLPAIEERPTGPGLNLLTLITYWQPGALAGARAYAAWLPEDSNAWNCLSMASRGGDGALSLELMRRASLLSVDAPLFAATVATMLLSRGRREEARAVAAELLAGGPERGLGPEIHARLIGGELVLAQVEASEAHFGAAAARAHRVLFGLPAFGRLVTTDIYLLSFLMDVSTLLGRAPESAEVFVRTFVDPDPPRLSPGRFVPARVASACALAPAPAARRCFERLRALLAAGFFREQLPFGHLAFIEGAEAFAEGDHAAAATAWQSLNNVAPHGRSLLPVAFERAGDADLAEQIDGPAAALAGPFNGAGLAHLRSARRALARGDRPRAEALARRIVDAWSAADVPVPAVAEMRSLLAGRPAPLPAARPGPGSRGR